MGHYKSRAKRNTIAIQAYLKKQEKSQINNLTLHLKQLEKEEMENLRESVLMRWMKLELIIQSEVSQKEKHQ